MSSSDEDEEEVEPTLVRDERDRELGAYRLCFELASGGMGTVYLARTTGDDGSVRAVAIKRIHPHLARNRKLVAMFLDEARIASRIRHPHVCEVFDFGEVRGRYYLAMEYLVGEPLSAVARAVRHDERRLAAGAWLGLSSRIVVDALEGLHAAHELRDERGEPLGIVHRDVSPQNLFVTYDGCVKVVDFGVAFARDRQQRTRTGAIRGKPAYMAPEQAAARPVDRRVDVWAVGVCFWELLTGRRLFAGAGDLDTLRAIESRPIVAPSEHNPSVPEELDAVVVRALAREADARFATALDFANAVRAARSTQGAACDDTTLEVWMHEVFAEERERRLGLLRRALEPDGQAIVQVHALETVRLPALGETEPTERNAMPADTERNAMPSDTVRSELRPPDPLHAAPTMALSAVDDELASRIASDVARARDAERVHDAELASRAPAPGSALPLLVVVLVAALALGVLALALVLLWFS